MLRLPRKTNLRCSKCCACHANRAAKAEMFQVLHLPRKTSDAKQRQQLIYLPDDVRDMGGGYLNPCATTPAWCLMTPLHCSIASTNFGESGPVHSGVFSVLGPRPCLLLYVDRQLQMNIVPHFSVYMDMGLQTWNLVWIQVCFLSGVSRKY